MKKRKEEGEDMRERRIVGRRMMDTEGWQKIFLRGFVLICKSSKYQPSKDLFQIQLGIKRKKAYNIFTIEKFHGPVL